MADTATTNMAGTEPGALLVTVPDAARILAVGRPTGLAEVDDLRQCSCRGQSLER